MAFYKRSYLQRIASQSFTILNEIKDEALASVKTASTKLTTFDIFISHSYQDKKTIFGIYKELTSLGYSIYVDWIVDKELDRDNVTKETAQLLRTRMKQSKSMFYAISNNSKTSKWMPWELGYFDGHNGKVAVFPVLEDNELTFNPPAYLRLYPLVDKAQAKGTGQEFLWINYDKEESRKYETWRN
ncbi:MAG TPA: TIR domain-containing protein [Chitinivibrionales bacterium]|nr:TIR domain-containing protein [Chitinivibrionales bacterium]